MVGFQTPLLSKTTAGEMSAIDAVDGSSTGT
jgi:hypothetical protein